MHTLNENTEIVLLLCGHFPQKEKNQKLNPLPPAEYRRLFNYLKNNKLKPSDLLEDLERFPWGSVALKKLDGDRIKGLLGRGMQMTLALENWHQKSIWVLSRADVDYPDRLKQHFRDAAPPILYGVGNRSLLTGGGLAMVGSRKVNEKGLNFTRSLAMKCARQNIQVVSGGAKGVDDAAMMASLEVGGKVIGVLSSKLEQAAVARKYRGFLMNGHLVLISPFSPHAGFNVGAAMGRNKYIYALSDCALAVDATEGKGGTWGGATENLKHRWVPLFVYKSENMPSGNQELIRRGALPMVNQVLDDKVALGSLLKKTRFAFHKTTQVNLPGMK